MLNIDHAFKSLLSVVSPDYSQFSDKGIWAKHVAL